MNYEKMCWRFYLFFFFYMAGSKLVVHGGIPLRGTVTPVPNKNSIIKLIPACLLTDETVTIHNVPTSSDVQYMLQILEKLGGTVEWFNNQTSLRINCSKVSRYDIDPVLSDKMKASVMFLGPLLLRFGKAIMPTPQGCKLGTRPLDVLVENMIEMGAIYEHKDGYYSFTVPENGLQAKSIWQRFPSVTGTENLILLAAKIPGKTVIYNAACEPHTQDLCNMLVSMGAKISGIGSNKLEIEGVPHLRGTEWTVISDHLDVGGLLAAAVMTEGEVTVKNAIIEHMGLILQVFTKLGIRYELDVEKNEIHIPQEQDLTIAKTVKGDILRVHALHRPLLPPDFVHTCVVLALKAKGQAIFDNLFYEYGRFFVQELAKMKANVVMANPVTVITTGPTVFKPADVVCSDIIQASYALLLAALAAKGTSTLNAITPLFRRFPNFVEQFTSLGARVELVEG